MFIIPFSRYLILISFIIFTPCFKVLATNYQMNCPDTATLETKEDCPWAGAARVLADPAQQVTLAQVLPTLYKQMTQDAKADGLKALWGDSINFDELAKGEIISPRILDELTLVFHPPSFGRKAQTTAKGYRVVHAGLEHTYGYVFSTLKTAFGFKRARWVKGEIERGFGLPQGLFSPSPKEGTLFSNISQFLGRISLQDDKETQKTLALYQEKVPAVIRNYSYAKLKMIRLLEETPSGITLRTDFIYFPSLPKPLSVQNDQKNTSLLIYSVLDPSVSPHARLITAFPVKEAFIKDVLKAENLGENKPILARYNAYVPTLTDASVPILGRRSLATVIIAH